MCTRIDNVDTAISVFKYVFSCLCIDPNSAYLYRSGLESARFILTEAQRNRQISRQIPVCDLLEVAHYSYIYDRIGVPATNAESQCRKSECI